MLWSNYVWIITKTYKWLFCLNLYDAPAFHELALALWTAISIFRSAPISAERNSYQISLTFLTFILCLLGEINTIESQCFIFICAQCEKVRKNWHFSPNLARKQTIYVFGFFCYHKLCWSSLTCQDDSFHDRSTQLFVCSLCGLVWV